MRSCYCSRDTQWTMLHDKCRIRKRRPLLFSRTISCLMLNYFCLFVCAHIFRLPFGSITVFQWQSFKHLIDVVLLWKDTDLRHDINNYLTTTIRFRHRYSFELINHWKMFGDLKHCNKWETKRKAVYLWLYHRSTFL